MERYISRSLKNWVARQPAPGNGRERLLEAAARETVQPPAQALAPVRWLEYVREFAYLQPAARPVNNWGRTSFTISMAWPVEIAFLLPATF